MSISPISFILASRSPRRLELLKLVVPRGPIVVVPPRDPVEAGFEELLELPAIECRLAEIARTKAACVSRQLSSSTNLAADTGRRVVIAADTVVVVTGPDRKLHVLGQPPEDETWPAIVRFWFREYYAGRTHRVLTALLVIGPEGQFVERLVGTRVSFAADVERRLDWYIDTEEPRGKAGGYALQGLASLFVSSVDGSLSNVVGLPLEALLEVFEELQVDVAG